MCLYPKNAFTLFHITQWTPCKAVYDAVYRICSILVSSKFFSSNFMPLSDAIACSYEIGVQMLNISIKPISRPVYRLFQWNKIGKRVKFG